MKPLKPGGWGTGLGEKPCFPRALCLNHVSPSTSLSCERRAAKEPMGTAAAGKAQGLQEPKQIFLQEIFSRLSGKGINGNHKP